jgi:four helix bundle protein
MNQHHCHGSSLPHHRLVVYPKALELLKAVRAAQVRDAKLRDEALRAAKGTCPNIAEGAGRVTRADKARAYAIARGECVECVAAVEIAGETGDAVASAVAEVTRLGNEVYLMLGVWSGRVWRSRPPVRAALELVANSRN